MYVFSLLQEDHDVLRKKSSSRDNDSPLPPLLPLARANYTNSHQLENGTMETWLFKSTVWRLINRSYSYLINSVIKVGLEGGWKKYYGAYVFSVWKIVPFGEFAFARRK